MASCFPRTILLVGSPVIVISGSHIQIIDEETGNVLKSTLDSPSEVKDSLKKSGPIRSAVLDPSKTHLATLADDKLLKIWKLDGLELLHERELPKRPTSTVFTDDGQTIVVADKFGDVFSYPLHPEPTPSKETQPEATSERNPQADPEHTRQPEPSKSTSGSVAEPSNTTTDLNPDPTSSQPSQSQNSKDPNPEPEPEPEPKKAKRRRKPKGPKKPENPPVPRDSLVSHAATSGTLILGHTSLLIACLLAKDEKGLNYIVTSDRDEHIRVSWYPQGYVIESYCLGSTQFISALHIPSFQPSVLISGGGDKSLMVWDWLSGKLHCEIVIWDKVEKFVAVKVKPYKRKENGNVKKAREGTELSEGVDMEVEGDSTPDAPVLVDEPEEEKVLVVQKITTSESQDGKRWILFSVVGATALFVTAYPQSTDSGFSSSAEIQTIDLGKPVLDFTTDEKGLVWACVDVNWDGPSEDLSSIAEVSPEDMPERSKKILETLNSKSHLIPATTEEIASLDLYSTLQTLPKNRGDEDGEGGDTPAGVAGPVPKYTRPRQGPNGGKKEKGKLKSKQAVRKALEDGPGEVSGEEREVKRPKADSENENDSQGVPMNI
ncbi:hypothetical protein D9758_015084 [Tetrapyrgos nigripes]|uniref:Transfer RNA methyltransferase 82 n=1 Tax=Tetrapyrgos nigripes TaxID=182062 RepID=A0A8H5C8Y1_9AGAR|nr:hypothetical protein D9758_015084 [Tetrapyrgos nigripes]